MTLHLDFYVYVIYSKRGLDEVSAIHGDPRLPTLGPGYLGPCSWDVLTVGLRIRGQMATVVRSRSNQ